MTDPQPNTKPTQSDVKTSKHAIRYFVVGASLAIFNYIVYAIIANLIIKNNNLLWLTSLIATSITAILGYIFHSKITWKERSPTKTSIYKFIIWNFANAIIVSPILTQLFNFLTPIYNFAFNLCNAFHIPFSYDFVQSTGAFIFANIVIMIINFLFYDRFVFGKTLKSKEPHES